MTINILEGGRRVRLIVQGVIAIGCFYGAFIENTPYISTRFEIASPKSSWVHTTKKCQNAASIERYLDDKIVLPGGYSTNVELCFRGWETIVAGRSTSDVWIDYPAPNGQVLTGLSTAPDVEAYLSKAVAAFSVPSSETQKVLPVVKEQWWSRYRAGVKDALEFGTILSLILWSVTLSAGWVFRGFSARPTIISSLPEKGNSAL